MALSKIPAHATLKLLPCVHWETHIVRADEVIIGIGFNEVKFQKLVKKATIYIARVAGEGDRLKESGPCIDCLKKIKSLGVKRMVFSTNTGTFEVHNPQDYHKVHTSSGKLHLRRTGCVVM